MILFYIQQYLSSFRSYWDEQSIPRKTTMIAGSIALTYCTAKLYSNKWEIMKQCLLNLPESVRRGMLRIVAGPGCIVDANIYPYALWMVYKINPDKIDKIQQLLPSCFTVMKHKIFANDKEDNYYLCYNIYMAAFVGIESIRLEINVIGKNKENKGCWITVDAYTDVIRMDQSIYPISAPNCKKKYFEVIDIDKNDPNKKQIDVGIYIDNHEKKHDLFDFTVLINLKDKPLIADDIWITANDAMCFGGQDREKVNKYSLLNTAEFDRNEHDNYLNGKVKREINNLFTGIRGELVTCFVIPNQQNYTIKVKDL